MSQFDPPLSPHMVYWGSSWKPNNQTDITRQKLRTVRQSRKSYMLVYLEQQRFKACLRRCQVVQNRVLFENVLGMRMLLLSGSEASNTCSNMHTIPFSPDMAGPQGKFCPFSSVFTPKFTLGHIFCTEIKILNSESHDLGLLSLYTFWAKCVYFSIFEW